MMDGDVGQVMTALADDFTAALVPLQRNDAQAGFSQKTGDRAAPGADFQNVAVEPFPKRLKKVGA
jgi:hypothetical protein